MGQTHEVLSTHALAVELYVPTAQVTATARMPPVTV